MTPNKHSQKTKERFLRLIQRGYGVNELARLAAGLIDRTTLIAWKRELSDS